MREKLFSRDRWNDCQIQQTHAGLSFILRWKNIYGSQYLLKLEAAVLDIHPPENPST